MESNRAGLGPFGDLPIINLEEGERLVFGSDQSIDQEIPFEKIEVTQSFSLEEVEKMSPAEAWQKHHDLGSEMGQAMRRATYAQIDEAVEAVGNTIQTDKVTAETLTEMVKKLDIDFDAFDPTIICHPEMESKIQAAWAELKANPELSAAFEAVIREKRERFREREITRKLVE